jgi:HK97 family phage portal protein
MKFNLFNRNKSQKRDNNQPLNYGINDIYTKHKSLTLSAVYRAIELKGNAVASIPLEVYSSNLLGEKIKYSKSNSLSYILNERPSSRLGSYTFWKMLTQDLDIYGNAYALIKRDKNEDIDELIYVPSNLVSIQNADMVFEDPVYLVAGYSGSVDHMDILHINNYSKNGVMGISTMEHARNTLRMSYDTEHSAGAVFKNGGKVSGIYTLNGYLDDEKRKEIEKNWRQTFTNPDSTGIVIMEQGDTFSPITLNNKDMMMIETRLYNVIDICRFFNVSPILLYDYTKLSYSALEDVMLEFLSTTIQPILTKIEKELNYKLIPQEERYTKHIKFDTSNFIKTNKATTSQFYSSLLNCGVLNINEVRNELGYKDIDGGDINHIQVNLMQAWESALGLKNKKEEENEIDNKLRKQ